MKIVVTGGQATGYVARYLIAGQTRFAGWLRVLFLSAAVASFCSDRCGSRHDCPGSEGIGRL